MVYCTPLERTLFRGQIHPILTYRLKATSEDCGELARDRVGPESLCHQPRRPRGVRVYHGGPMGEGQHPESPPGSTRLMPGWNPIYRDELRWKNESGNTWVAPKGDTPVFPDFSIFLVSLTFPSSVFWLSDHLLSEVDQIYTLCLAQTLVRLS